MREFLCIRDVVHRASVQLNHLQHWSDVVLGNRFLHAAGARIAITGERRHCPCQPRALRIRFAGHDRRDRAAECPAFDAVVTMAVTHDQRAEICVTEPERAENM